MRQVILTTGNAAGLADVNPEAIVLDYTPVPTWNARTKHLGYKPAGQVFCQGRLVRLTPSQFRIASCIVAARGKTVSADAIMEALYGDDPDGGPEEKTIDVHLCKIRKALPALGIAIETVWGRGYRAVVVAAPAQSKLRVAA